jgi:uncharacterized membrane protein YjjP (DUF1212 family)
MLVNYLSINCTHSAVSLSCRIVVAILVSFVARLLNSIGGHVFCYSAISSSGVVLILPGFLVRVCRSLYFLGKFFLLMMWTSVQGSLELASKNFITGATKIVYAIIYSLILASLLFINWNPIVFSPDINTQGFSLTLGSDIAFLINSSFREQRDQMAADIGQTVSLVGTYTAINATNLLSPLNGTFLFDQLVLPDEPLVKYHYILEGCYRDTSWSIVFQPFTWPWLFALAPLFVLCLATLNGQGWRDWRRLLVIVVFGCCSFAANKVFNMWIYDRGDVVSAIGATVVGILGTIYGHYSEGDALPSMIPGILVLLPVKFKFANIFPCPHPNINLFPRRLVCPLSVASVPIFTIPPARSPVGLALGLRWFKARCQFAMFQA